MIDKKSEEIITTIIYEYLDYMYCDNCRFGTEISEEESNKRFGYWGCEDCHRKYNGWGISNSYAEGIAKKIIEKLKEGE